jgi:hypothetical protein
MSAVLLADVEEQPPIAQLDKLTFIARDVRHQFAPAPGPPVILAHNCEDPPRLELPQRNREATIASLDSTTGPDDAGAPLGVRQVARHARQVHRLRPGRAVVVAGAREDLDVVRAGARV